MDCAAQRLPHIADLRMRLGTDARRLREIFRPVRAIQALVGIFASPTARYYEGAPAADGSSAVARQEWSNAAPQAHPADHRACAAGAQKDARVGRSASAAILESTPISGRLKARPAARAGRGCALWG